MKKQATLPGLTVVSNAIRETITAADRYDSAEPADAAAHVTFERLAYSLCSDCKKIVKISEESQLELATVTRNLDLLERVPHNLTQFIRNRKKVPKNPIELAVEKLKRRMEENYPPKVF